jgi:hypothetical protein
MLYTRYLTKNIGIKITNEIIKKERFRKLIFLDVSRNKKITDINHLTNLKILYANTICCYSEYSGISDKSISELRNMDVLHANGNC